MKENRFALIIANNQFTDPGLEQLEAPAQDAEDLARVLANLNIGGFEVKTLLNKPSHEVKQAIETFFIDNRNRDDLLLLYLSTHGHKSDDGQLYFAHSDTKLNLLRSTAVSAQFVRDTMHSSRSRRQVILLDCCNSGAFTRGMKTASRNAGTVEEFQGRGRFVLTASDAMQYAFEGNKIEGQGLRSVFTRILVQGLETGEADLDQDGFISPEELYEYIYARIGDEQQKQTPQKSAFDVEGKIFIARNIRPLLKPVELLNEYIDSQSPVPVKPWDIPLIARKEVTLIDWSPSGKAFLSCEDDIIKLWEIETGKLYLKIQNENKVSGALWSPNGGIIAAYYTSSSLNIWEQTLFARINEQGTISKSNKRTKNDSKDYITLWNARTGELYRTLEGHSEKVSSLAWSPDGMILASGSADKTIKIWNTQTGELYKTLEGHSEKVSSLAWSPDGKILASGSADKTIRIWSPQTGELYRILEGRSKEVLSLAWSPDGKILASSFEDETIKLWNPETWQQVRILEGHTNRVRSLSFTSDGRFLATSDGVETRIWRCDVWQTVLVFKLTINSSGFASSSKENRELLTIQTHIALITLRQDYDVKFHPNLPVIATLGCIWELDTTHLLCLDKGKAFEVERKTLGDKLDQLSKPEIRIKILQSEYYTNAKIVLVGDTGVGKSGLGLVLTGQDFEPTESTHSRHVWTFDSENVESTLGRTETHETLLWDLAGQPGYRLIHQLHLNEIAVALVIFDARSEADPFAGVRHWERALRQAQRLHGSSAPPLKKFLVAARCDRGGVGVSKARIDSLVHDLNFDDYFQTSAKEKWQIPELIDTLRRAIDWEAIPKVSSTELFQKIKAFLIKQKEAKHLLSAEEELYHSFLQSEDGFLNTKELQDQFKTCIGLVESRGLIRRLSFGSIVLLKPELLDAYASAIVNTAKDEPDGLGSIAEEDLREGRFRISEDERVKDKEQEKLLLIATAEDLLRHEIALREHADDGQYLVFPSQFTREYPNAPDPEGKAVIFKFEGAVLNVYAMLAVRLSHSGLFEKQTMWRNAATYKAKVGGVCGIFLREIEEGRGELTLFFDSEASEETRFQFEEYINVHLRRRAIPESVFRQRIFICTDCGFIVSNQLVELRADRGLNWVKCPNCEQNISLLDREERLLAARSTAVPEMDRAADVQREREMVASIIQGKIETNDFDVLFCCNNDDIESVKVVEKHFKGKGILPLLYDWESPLNNLDYENLEKEFEKIKVAVVFIGNNKKHPWQNIRLKASLDQFIERCCLVIAVILPDVRRKPQLPNSMKNTTIDFRKVQPDPMELLILGVTSRLSEDFG